MAADMYVWQFSASAGLAAEDLFLVVDDPAGSPLYKKATGTQLIALMEASIDNITFANTGLKVWDTAGDHYLTVCVNENLSANRTLNVVVDDGSRALTLTGDLDVEATSLINQDLTTDSTAAAFAVLTLANSGLHILDTNASHDLIITPGSDLTADRILTITTGDAARTLTLSANLTVESTSLINQDLTTDSATAQFTTLGLGQAVTYETLYVYDSASDANIPTAMLRARQLITLTAGAGSTTSAFLVDNSYQAIGAGLTYNGGAILAMNIAGQASTAAFAGTLTTQYGLSCTAGILSSNAAAVVTTTYGAYCKIYNRVVGATISLGYAGYFDCAEAKGTTTTQYGVYGQAGCEAQGTAGVTITNAYGGCFKIRNAVAGVTITNGYGCYVDNSEAIGTVTNRWDLYCASATAKNYFAGNVGIGQTTFGTNATKTLAVGTGAAPTTSPADAFQIYSADQAAGNACPHIRTENGGIVKIYQSTVAVAEAAFIANAGGTAVNVDSTFGGYTLQQVVQALQAMGILQ